MTQITAKATVARHQQSYVDEVSKPIGDLSVTWAVVFVLLHVPLGFVMRFSPLIGQLHAPVVSVIGFFVILSDRRLDGAILVTGYIVTAEMLWRMTDTAPLYEYGKYSVTLLLILSLVVQRRTSRIDILPIFYVLLLVPALIRSTVPQSVHNTGPVSLLDLPVYYLGIAREDIAFNFAGPVALAIAATYFSTVKFSRLQVIRLLLVLFAPIVSVWVLAVSGTIAAENIRWFVSTKVTAGGVGPNQVSSILGLGALLGFLLIFLIERHHSLRVAIGVLSLALLTQALLTFSRGGVYTTVGAVIAASYYLLRDPRSRKIYVPVMAVGILTVAVVIVPQLQSLTGGALGGRFQNTDLSSREDIIAHDFQTFLENPLFGVGVGQAPTYITSVSRRVGLDAHIEYTRMLSEHGLFGALALAVLAFLAARRFLVKQPPYARALAVSFTVWALLFMAHSATRLVAPSYMFGLASATFLLSDNGEEASNEEADLGP